MSMNFHETALAFLVSSHQFPIIDQNDNYFQDRLDLQIKLDSINLLDKSPTFVEFLLSDPDNGRDLFEEVIQGTLQQQGLRLRISVQVIFISLPRSDPVYTINSCLDFPPLYSTENSPPKSLFGILLSKSSVSNYTRRARYLCPNVICPFSKNREYFDLTLSSASRVASFQDKLKCTLCGTLLEEDVRCREVVQCTTCHFIPSHFLEGGPCDVTDWTRGQFQGHHQAINVLVSAEWFSDLRLGQRYEVIGRVSFIEATKISATPLLECLHLSAIPSPASRYARSAVQNPHLSTNIYNIFRKSSQTSPWAFVTWLSVMFGENVCPRGTFFHLKMNILLSMAMLSDQGTHGPISLLVASSDCSVVNYLFMYSLSLVNRKIIHSMQNPLGCTVKKVGQQGYQVEAGSLLLADTGVCYLGELQRFQKETLYNIKTALESGEIRTEVPQSELMSTDLEMSSLQNLKSTVWAFNTLPSSTRDAKNKFCQKMKYLIDVFGMVIFPESDILDEDRSLAETVANQSLSVASPYYQDQSFISNKEWKLFLLMASERQVTLSSEAEILLKKYFVASRHARNILGVAAKGTQFPQSAMNILTELSKSHAKLSLRSVVTFEDAVAACRIYELNISAMSGYAPLGLKLGQHFFDVRQNFFYEYNSMMEEFSDTLTSFINENVEDSNITWEE